MYLFTTRLKKSAAASMLLSALAVPASHAFADPVPLSFKGSCSAIITGGGEQGLGHFEVNADGNPHPRFQTIFFDVLRTSFTTRIEVFQPDPNVEAVSVRVGVSSPDFTNVAIAANAAPGTRLNSQYFLETASRRALINCIGEVLKPVQN